MASFCGGCGEVVPRPAGWPSPDASRFSNVREGGQVAALPSSARLRQWATNVILAVLADIGYGPKGDRKKRLAERSLCARSGRNPYWDQAASLLRPISVAGSRFGARVVGSVSLRDR